MNTTDHLAQLLALPAAEFARYVESVSQLAQLRRNIEPAAPAISVQDPPVTDARHPLAPVAQLPKVAAIVPKRLASRPPMRAAKPGSLRGDLHDILRGCDRPMQRIAIIKALADRRGRAVDKRFAAKVSDLLANPHDPFIARVSRGVYALSEDRN